MTSRVRMRPEIAALGRYRQGRPAPEGGFKLSSNELAERPFAEVLAAIAAEQAINRYPDATAPRLRHALSERFGRDSQAVHVGNGSVAILAQLISATSGPGDNVVYSWRSFEAYPLLVTQVGAQSKQVANRPDGGHDLDAMAAAVDAHTRLVLVCTPNNPTGPIVTAADFERFMARVPEDTLVVLDEAYAEFVTDPTAVNGVEVIDRHPNLAVLRSFSKAWGLAGLRVGYALAEPTILDAARAAALPLSVTAAAESAAVAALTLADEVHQRALNVANRRFAFRQALIDLGFSIPEAQGNFVWIPAGTRTTLITDRLYEAGIVVRPFGEEGLRISIGEPAALAQTLEVLRGLA